MGNKKDMKRLMIRFLIVVCLLFPNLAGGQNIEMVTDQMETVFKLLRPTERKVLVKEYIEVLTSSFLSQEEKEQIDSVFQKLQELKTGATSELKDYVNCVNYFYRCGEKENLLIWLSGIQQHLTSSEWKRGVIKNYLEATQILANEQAIFNGGNHKWLVRGKMRWESGQPIRINFSDANLICTTSKDSIQIIGTSGCYLIGTNQVTGRGGKVKWSDFDNSMEAELSGYQIDLKVSGYTMDSVRFHYDQKYDHSILGQLKDNALKYERMKATPFPQFTSYAMDIQIAELYPHISYRGGIDYSGTKFTGIGTVEHPACLKIAPNDSISMNLYAVQFLFDSLHIVAGRSALVVAMDSGEITHPDIHFMYSIPKHTATIKRISERSLQLPFRDSYHCILFDVEKISWLIDDPYMEMSMINRSDLMKATFESLNFFTDQVYDHIQGMDEVNPLNGLLKCSLRLKSKTFTVNEYATYLKKSAGELRKQIVLLSYNDFVDFNETRDEITLKQRLYDYTKARVGKQDYDNIRFTSLPGKNLPNAQLDVRNYTLKISGVEKFVISEARNISVEPSDKQIVMLKNRDMALNGKLYAGMFDMYGENLFFSYDQYKIVLPKVDSTGMYRAGRDKNVRGEKVKSVIRDIIGEVIIDKPGNKSGKQDDPGYPILNSTKESYVYFDAPTIQQGSYKRDSFYYVIKPYSIKGINDVDRFQYAFQGTLVSNIISPIDDTLRLMEDNTLGLTYQTPVDGIELYGKGRINSSFTMSREGLWANGTVTLNHSEFRSDSILMLPRKMTARTREIQVNAVKDLRPDAQGKEVMIKYLPQIGNLQAISTKTPFNIYAGRIKHNGTLSIYDDRMDASGKLELKEALLDSRLLHLQTNHILSKNADLHIASDSNQNIRLNTSNVQADIDLSAYTGKFVNNTNNNRIEFNSCRYACTFESFTWYMKEAYLNIGIEDQTLLEKVWKIEDTKFLPKQGKNNFISTDRLTDSLNFIAPLVRYDLNGGNLDCQKVNHIDIANGRFYPALGNIAITADGTMGEFEAGKLRCDRSDSTKALTDTHLNIKGRYHFSGNGNYIYTDDKKKNTVIHFTEIGVDSLKQIIAKAELKEEEPLLLNDGFCFKGNVHLHSKHPNLFFAGYISLTADKTYLKHTWMAVNHYLAAEHIQIPVGVEHRDDKKLRIFNAIFLHTDKSYRPYGAFMSSRSFYNDDLLVGGKGKMEWFAPVKQYVITDTVADRYYRFCYDPTTSTISSFSKLELSMQIPGLYQKMAGSITYNLKEETLKINRALLALDFTVLPKMEAILLKNFTNKKLNNIHVTSDLRKKIYEICGFTGRNGANKQLNRPTDNVPDSLNQLLLLDSLDF
ncbi:MAG: hypothetical protein RSB69_11775, partial [Odoribacter sp.]